MFRSTRGNELISSQQAILNGIASDGGLYVIDKIPSIKVEELLNLDYPTLAARIIQSFFSDFTFDQVYDLVNEAYKSFDISSVVDLHKTDDSYYLELFHGPTLAFKDLALVVLPRLMALSKKVLNDNTKTTILTATSGDTGGAALNGFKDIPLIDICVFYPNNGVSPIQEKQMLSFKSPSAKVIALQGNFDDCQNFVKEFFKENKDLDLSSANSINIARLVPQIVYYFYSYIYLVNTKAIKLGDKINFTVPTGNFGDIFAGFYAMKMGLPINKLICASNENKVLTDFFNNKVYDKNREFYRTNSPSMDILISSNLERLLFYAADCNPDKVKELMSDLNSKGKYDFANPFDCFYADFADLQETDEAIRNVFKNSNYLVDPHTAVAYSVYQKYVKETSDKSVNVIISTASPYKFPHSVIKALGGNVPIDCFEMLKELSKLTNTKVPSALDYPYVEKEVWSKNEAMLRLRRYIKNGSY